MHDLKLDTVSVSDRSDRRGPSKVGQINGIVSKDSLVLKEMREEMLSSHVF